jgi:uncharacterized membrane protein YdjX (TVP38/TMEM64 family)
MLNAVRIAVLLTIIALCAYYYSYFTPQYISNFVSEHAASAPLFFILICAIRPVLFFMPAIGLTIVAGILFGALWGTVYVAIGGAISTITGYFFAKWIGRRFVLGLVEKNAQLAEFEKKAVSNGRSVVLYMRLFNLPWDLVSYWAGLQGVRFRDFYISSLIALVPASFVYTYFGSTIFTPFSAGFNVSLAVIFLLGSLPFAKALWDKNRPSEKK